MEKHVTYWMKPETKLMYKVLSATEIVLLQVDGRDLTKKFSHRHESVAYPSKERLAEETAHMIQGTANDWEDLMNEYLQVNKEKLAIMNKHRQMMYNEGKLRL